MSHDHQIVILSLRHSWTNQSKHKCISGDAPIGKNQKGLKYRLRALSRISQPLPLLQAIQATKYLSAKPSWQDQNLGFRHSSSPKG